MPTIFRQNSYFTFVKGFVIISDPFMSLWIFWSYKSFFSSTSLI